MARTEKRKKQREFAKSSEASVFRETSTAPSGMARPIGARPRSEVTGSHDAGTGANETRDGLTFSEEATRRGAEETPIGVPERELEDLPVFDRAGALPKV
jgi:hypothetical protein